ncbi:hypothetical protein JCM3774_004456 [Rhodotorula dairenensis]
MALGPTSGRRGPSPEEPDDAVDIFADSLEALYDHHVPAHGDPLQLYTYTPPAGTGAPNLTVRLPPQQVQELFAHHVWNASLRLADAIAEERLVTRGETVVELGAGAGIPSLMAARAGAKRVVLTDYDDPLIVANMRSNIALALPELRTSSVSAEGHCWGDAKSLNRILAANDHALYSMILLADTLWVSSAHDLLLSSLVQLLERTSDARIAICAGFHSGRRTVRRFVQKAAVVGLVPRGAPWQEVGVDGGRREWIHRLRDVGGGLPASNPGDAAAADDEEEWDEEDASERNKFVVEGLLGWSDQALA